MDAAKTIGGDYAAGYQRGLRRHHHGDNFGTLAEHEMWLAMSGHRQEQGDGYRDGCAGAAPRGFHGNLGNQNAAGVDADSHLHIRLPADKKAAYVHAAQRAGMKLSAWVLEKLDDAAS